VLNLKVIVSAGPCEDDIARCLASIRAQRYADWHALVTVDPCGDRTVERAVEAAGGDSRIDIQSNAVRMFSMANLIEGVRRSRAEPDDVIVVLDGDDWFYDDASLDTIARTYARHDCWMTYGSWISNDPLHRGMPRGLWPPYPDETVDFRNALWLHTAVRTWKKWLWDLIDDQDFRDETGEYFRVTEDQASMLPMLEMSGTRRARHIPDILMVYNRTTPHACGKVRRAEMLRNAERLRHRRSYERLSARPEAADRPRRPGSTPGVSRSSA
jgi:glycosyltransferase involved in cell wall biosynthesis